LKTDTKWLTYIKLYGRRMPRYPQADETFHICLKIFLSVKTRTDNRSIEIQTERIEPVLQNLMY